MPASRSSRNSSLGLLLIVSVYLIIATMYAAQVPAWQAPDEPAHYNYIHELATTGQFPVLKLGDYDEAYLELLKSQKFPADLPIHPIRYEAHQPPLYYLLATGVFDVTGGKLLPLRLVSVVLGALLIVLTYAIAGLVLPGQRAIHLGAAALVAFLPMHVATTAALNNDALAEVLLTVVLLLSIRYVKLGLLGPAPPRAVDALLLGVVTGLALITKVSAYVAVPVVLAALGIGWFEGRGRSGEGGGRNAEGETQVTTHASRVVLHAGLVIIPALALALPWYVRNAQLYGNLDILGRQWHDAVVVGQLRTGELIAQAGLGPTLERMLVWTFDSFWGVFGWMGVWMDGRIYTLLLAWSLPIAVGCIALLTRQVTTRRTITSSPPTDSPIRPSPIRPSAHSPIHHLPIPNPQTANLPIPSALQPRFQRWAFALLALAALLTLGIYGSYNLIFVQPQGRYLFPALPIIGLAVALGWREALRPRTARWAGLVLVGAALVALGWTWWQGNLNPWPVAILVSGGGALLAWHLAAPRLARPARHTLALLAYALPFAVLPLLDVLALNAFILPQLT